MKKYRYRVIRIKKPMILELTGEDKAWDEYFDQTEEQLAQAGEMGYRCIARYSPRSYDKDAYVMEKEVDDSDEPSDDGLLHGNPK